VNCIPFELPGFRITDVEYVQNVLEIHASRENKSALCPRCGTLTKRVHSQYVRKPYDLPSSGRGVRLVLGVQRFRCGNQECPQQVFCERLEKLVGWNGQRTERLLESLTGIGLRLGGEAGAQHSQELGMSASRCTLLRCVRKAPLTPRPTPRVLGVDDFALRKGQVYGTILVDGETHEVVDLLPDRSAETLATWLEAHPEVEIITRDRSTEYARGCAQGAPQARQVADRWHLLVNLREALERVLNSLRATFPVPAEGEETPLSVYDRSRRRGTKDQQKQQASRIRRYALYAQVKVLHTAGKGIATIARELNISRQTVRTYIASETFPEWPRPPRRKSILDPYVDYLQKRWDEGCHDTRQLHRELQQQGFAGSSRSVWQWTALRRKILSTPSHPGRPPSRQVEVFVPPEQRLDTSRLPASSRLAWLLLHPPTRLDEEQLRLRSQLRQHPAFEHLYSLTQQFLTLVRNRQVDALLPWIADCQSSSFSALQSFADGLLHDLPVITVALELPFSNGVTEGHVNRLKTIKRAMYGRANFDLLRTRVLA
jgi:transposase